MDWGRGSGSGSVCGSPGCRICGLSSPVAQAAARRRLDSDPGSGRSWRGCLSPPPGFTHFGNGVNKRRGGGSSSFRVVNPTIFWVLRPNVTPKKLNGREEHLLRLSPLESRLWLPVPHALTPSAVVNAQLGSTGAFIRENLPKPGTKLPATVKLSSFISSHSRCGVESTRPIHQNGWGTGGSHH